MAEREIQYAIKLSFSKGSDVLQKLNEVQTNVNNIATAKGVTASGPLAALKAQLDQINAGLVAMKQHVQSTPSGTLKEQVNVQTQKTVNKNIKDFFAAIETEALKDSQALVDAIATERVKFFKDNMSEAVHTASNVNRNAGRTGAAETLPESLLASWWENRKKPGSKFGQAAVSAAALAGDVELEEDPMLRSRRRRQQSTDSAQVTGSLAEQREEARQARQARQTGGVEPGAEEILKANRAKIEEKQAAIEAAEAERLLAEADAERRKVAEGVAPVDSESIALLRERSKALTAAKDAALGGAERTQGGTPAADVAKERNDQEERIIGIVEDQVAAKKELDAVNNQVADSNTAVTTTLGKTVDLTEKSVDTTKEDASAKAAETLASLQQASAEKTLADAKARTAAGGGGGRSITPHGGIAGGDFSEPEPWARRPKINFRQGLESPAAGPASPAATTEVKAYTGSLKEAAAATATLRNAGSSAAEVDKVEAKLKKDLKDRVEQSTGALLANVRAEKASQDAKTKNKSKTNEAREAQEKLTKEMQRQMAAFDGDNTVLSDADYELQKLVARLAEAAQGGGDFDETLGILTNRIARLASESGADVEELGVKFGLTADQAKRLNSTVGSYQANQQFRETFQQTRSIGATFRGFSGISTAANRLGFGGVADASQGVGDFAELAEQIPRLKAALKALPATLADVTQKIGAPTLGLVGALTALAIVTQIAMNQDKEQVSRATAVLDAQAAYFALIQTGTSESLALARKDIDDHLNAELGSNALLKQERERLNAEINALLGSGKNTDFANSPLLKLAETMGITGGSAKVLDDKITASDVAIVGFNKDLSVNAQATQSAQVALNDLTLAEKYRASQLIGRSTAQLQLQQQIIALQDEDSTSLLKHRSALEVANDQLRVAQQGLGTIPMLPAGVDNPLADQFNAWQKEIEDNQTIIGKITNTYLDAAWASEKLHKAAGEHLADLKKEMSAQTENNQLLNSTPGQVGDLLQSIADGLGVLENSQFSLLQTWTGTEEEVAQFRDNLNEITRLERERQDILADGPAILLKARQALQGELNQIALDLTTTLAGLSQDLFDKNQEAIAQAAADEQAALDKKNKDLEKAKKDFDEKDADALKKHQDKLLDIQEKYGQDIEDAIRGRNAAAAITAIRNANKARKDEAKSYDDQKKDLAKSRKDQEDAIEASYQDQLDTIKDKLKQQEEANKKAYDAQVKNATEAAARETAAKVKAFNDQSAALIRFLDGQAQLTSQWQATQLVDQFRFNYNSGLLASQLYDNWTAWLSKLANYVTGNTTKPGTYYDPVTGHGNAAVTLNTTVNVKTNANPDEIAAAVAKKQAAALKGASRRVITPQ